jgi:type II secretory pathway predicted ATPase ExeA
MEYLKFFDLPSDPFQNESDERFYYESAPQKRARLRLVRGIHQRKALSVLVGGPGLGKTTLAHSLLRALDPREFAAHYLSIPHEACASGWFLPNVARAFGVHAPSPQIQTLVDQIHAQLVSIAARNAARCC